MAFSQTISDASLQIGIDAYMQSIGTPDEAVAHVRLECWQRDLVLTPAQAQRIQDALNQGTPEPPFPMIVL